MDVNELMRDRLILTYDTEQNRTEQKFYLDLSYTVSRLSQLLVTHNKAVQCFKKKVSTKWCVFTL